MQIIIRLGINADMLQIKVKLVSIMSTEPSSKNLRFCEKQNRIFLPKQNS